MAKMKNNDCPASISYVAVESEKEEKFKINWVEVACWLMDWVLLPVALMLIGGALAANILLG